MDFLAGAFLLFTKWTRIVDLQPLDTERRPYLQGIYSSRALNPLQPSAGAVAQGRFKRFSAVINESSGPYMEPVEISS